jgi:quercetin dioxygenase-like cupin family protein
MSRVSFLTLGLVVTMGTALAGRAKPAATHVSLADAPVREAPPGSAKIHLLAEGKEAFIGRLVVKPGAKVPEHRDPTEEYIHVLRGGGRMSVDGAVFEVSVGDTVYMPAKARVWFENGEVETEVLQVFSGPQPAQKYDAWRPVAPEALP